MGADDGIPRGGDECVEFFIGERDAADGVVVGERLLDSPCVEDRDDDVSLVFGEGFAEADFRVLEATVDTDDALDGRWEARVEARLGEGADGFSETDDDCFLCLTEDETAGGDDDCEADCEDQKSTGRG